MRRRRARVWAPPLASALTLAACLARFEVGGADPASETGDGPSSSSTTKTESSAETGTAGGETGALLDCGQACDPLLELCIDGDCECRPGFVPCAGVCVDLDSDPGNCGACGETCDAGACEDGECRAQGCTEHSECAGACVELDENPLHCGACDNPCAGDELCIEAACVGYVPVDCDADLDCGAGSCCEFELLAEFEHVCVDGDQCP